MYYDITEKIIRAAYTVHKALGYGFLERIYENALLIELSSTGLKVTSQIPIDVQYRGQIVGHFKGDLLVNGVVLVEIKSAKQLVPEFEVQLVNYLTATQIEIGLLINFSQERVDVKRKFRDYTPQK